jgi:HTTM domain
MSFVRSSLWVRFWHEPVRAERLAAVRIALGLMLLADQLLQYVPNFADLFGPHGTAYAGLYDEELLTKWRWTILVFGTDDLRVLWPVFGLWVALTVAFTLGWRFRWTSVALWFLTMCFLNRNPVVTNRGDAVLQAGLFLLMFMPASRALSLDRLRERRRQRRAALPFHDPPMIEPWGVRLIQIQVCVIYFTTGMAKLGGTLIHGSWGTGTSVHYVLNDVTMARVSSAEMPLPLWFTAICTYATVFWETSFTFLVMFCRSRKWALWFGVLFHVGIYLAIEVGWFSFYTLALYGVWIPDTFWDRWRRQ